MQATQAPDAVLIPVMQIPGPLSFRLILSLVFLVLANWDFLVRIPAFVHRVPYLRFAHCAKQEIHVLKASSFG